MIDQPPHTLDNTGMTGQWRSNVESVNWAYWLGVILQGRWWILASTAVALFAGLVHFKLSVPIYQSDALVQYESSKSPSTMAGVNAMGYLDDTPAFATEIEVLKSRSIMGQAVTFLGADIMVQPHYFPVIGEWLSRGKPPVQPGDAALWGFAHYAWGGEQVEVSQFEVPDSLRGASFLLQAGQAANTYVMRQPDGRLTRLLQVGRTETLQVAGKPVLVFVKVLRARPGAQFTLSKLPLDIAIDILRSRLAATPRGTTGLNDFMVYHPDPAQAQRLLQGILNVYLRQHVERKSAEADQTLRFLDEQLPVLKKQLDIAESNYNAFRVANKTLNVTAEAGALLDKSVQVETAIGQLEQRRKELMQRFTAEHPTVKAIDGQIATLRGQVAQADSEFSSMPKLEKQMLNLMRDVQVANDLYVGLLNRAQEFKVAKAGTVGNVRIIDGASYPRGPVSPVASRLLAIYFLVGLLLGLALVLLRQLLKPGIKEARLIEQALGLPVYATIPRADDTAPLKGKVRHGTLLAKSHPDDPAIEALRSLRTALQFATLDATNPALLIAGPAPGVGKSFVAANLAMVLAQAGKRVVLIDSDMRRGYLHEFFGLPSRETGLSDYLAGESPLEQVLRPDCGTERLSFITTGAIPPNPSELLLHPRFDTLVRELCAGHDHVVFDAGPLLAVTDSAIIGRLCGTTLLVARYEVTPLRELELAAQRLVQAGCSLRGVVFNDVQKHGAYGYGYGYGYQYTYAYKSVTKPPLS